MLFFAPYRCRLFLGISATTLVILLAGISVAADNVLPLSEKHDAKPAEDVVSGQTTVTPQERPDRITGEYVKGYFTDSGKMLASPLTWEGSDWLKAGLIIGATSGLYFADADIRNFAQRNQSSAGDSAAAIGNGLGNPLYSLPPLGLFYLYGHFNEDPKARRASLLAVESVAISGAVTMTIKAATRRSRPETGESPTTWNTSGSNPTSSSFPSVHTQTAFSIASVLAEEYGNNPFVPPVAYGLATLTGLSRVYDNKHWASDVFLGAAVGYFVGKTVVRYHTEQNRSAVMLLPTLSQQGFGLMAEYRF